MRRELRRLLDRQAEEFSRLTDAEARAFLAALEDGRRDIAERIRVAVGKKLEFTPYQLRATQLQIDAGIAQLRTRLLTQVETGIRRAEEKAVQHAIRVLELEEEDFKSAAVGLESAALRRMIDLKNTLLYQHSIERYTADQLYRLQAGLIQGQVQRLTLDQLVERLAGRQDSVLAGMRSRAELVARMETARAYDASHQASLEEAERLLDVPDDPDPLLVRADEYFDARNHPFSRVVDGMTRPVKGVWKVSRSEVETMAAKMGKSAGGVVWPLVGGFYVGSQYPAHFNDRGRQTPWRKSWDQQSKTDVLSAGLPPPQSGPTPRSPDLGEEATLEQLLSSKRDLRPGSDGVLLRGVSSREWFEGRAFNPDLVPRQILFDAYRLSQKLGAEVAILSENGRVRLLSGAHNLVHIPEARSGQHLVAHTHPVNRLPSKQDIRTLAHRVEIMQLLDPAISTGDLGSIIISGLNEEGLAVFYGNV